MSRLAGLKLLLFSACALPAALLLWRAFNGDLGANPIETLEHETGIWALRLLLVTLAMTPLRQLSGRAEFIQVRRMLGLYSFFYVSCHFAIFLVFDLSLSLAALFEEIIERPYITVGFSAWLLLLPLAITSTRGWQQRLKRNWKRLHRLIYPAVLLACVHFLWKVKADPVEPLIYLGIALALLALRLPRVRALLQD